MKNRTVIYPNNSSAISSITIYPQDRMLGVEYTSSCKAYAYVIRDLSVIYDLVETQIFNESMGKCINSAIKANRISAMP
jgi:hypothetical protein